MEYADKTGKECRICHLSESGGPRLTAEGKRYKEKLAGEGLLDKPSLIFRIVKFFIGFLHMVTAIMWFGTILYIHIILKPKYVAGGIPRGELKIGWISMLIMLVTGIYLTVNRFPSLESLVTTGFGILLLVKLALFLFMVITIFIITFYIAPRINRSVSVRVSRTYGDLTSKELLQYNGKEGNPAYIAYKGIIYDVSGSRLWPGGRHMGRHPSGIDLTDTLAGAPHGEDLVKILPVVGKLLGAKNDGKDFPVKLFYFLAYSILVIIFLIIFIISIWRWW